MSDSFQAQHELVELRRDALDKLRTETARHLRKYARRIKSVGEDRVKAAFALNPGADPETVADEALLFASQGQLLLTSGQVTDAATETESD